MKELELLNQISGFDVRGERLCEVVDACYGEGAWGSVIAAMKDAERYRWLVSSGKYAPAMHGGGWGLRIGAGSKSAKVELDEAIDAAMREQGANAGNQRTA